MIRTLGITAGEPCGIGPELIVRSASMFQSLDCDIILFGNESVLMRTARQLDISPFWNRGRIHLVNCNTDKDDFEHTDRGARADLTLAALHEASRRALKREIESIVTCPIDKSVVRVRLPDFTGHTGYLAELAEVSKTVMLLDNTELRVILLTEHVALRDVASVLTRDLVETSILISIKALTEQYGFTKLKIAVAGVNPHAGETVRDAEEEQVLKPVISMLRDRGISIEGPFAADTLFPLARNGRWDLLVSPYHDQGLVAAKYPGLDKVINVTLGLPYARVSPGHGTAYDLVGKGCADLRSFHRAVTAAAEGKFTS